MNTGNVPEPESPSLSLTVPEYSLITEPSQHIPTQRAQLWSPSYRADGEVVQAAAVLDLVLEEYRS